jgi:hypothetical protein
MSRWIVLAIPVDGVAEAGRDAQTVAEWESSPDEADRAAGRRGANGRPPVSMEHKTVLVRQRARLEKARAWLELVPL